jgi:hypothetical protein
MNSNTLAILVALGVGGGMLLLGNMANASRNREDSDPISSAWKALDRWSEETGNEITLSRDGANFPGRETVESDGMIVVDVSPTTIRFLRADDGELVSAPEMADQFKEWLAKHPELTP